MGVEERRDGAITVITIDRPQAHNAVDRATAVDLADAIRRFGADDDAAILVLTHRHEHEQAGYVISGCYEPE